MSALGDPAVHEYILGADESERSRLLLQSEIHRAQAERLLERLDVGSGGRVIDIGCGPLGVLDLLSMMVGRNGRAIGLDNEPRMIAHARRTIAEWNLANVELVLADAADTGIEAGSLDRRSRAARADQPSSSTEHRRRDDPHRAPGRLGRDRGSRHVLLDL